MHAHYPLAAEALNANKHVFVDKPLAASSRQCEELIELVYFPSGGVRSGERLEGARRELKEEVGIDLPPERFSLAFEMQLHHNNMRDRVSTTA